MIESSFWKSRLRRQLVQSCQALGLTHHIDRVENSVVDGSPDVDYCIDTVAGKIELKFTDHDPVRKTTPVLGRTRGLRRSQIIWIARRLHAGGIVFAAIGTPSFTWLVDLRGWTPQMMQSLELKTSAELGEISAWASFRDPWTYLPMVLTDRPS